MVGGRKVHPSAHDKQPTAAEKPALHRLPRVAHHSRVKCVNIRGFILAENLGGSIFEYIRGFPPGAFNGYPMGLLVG